MAGGTFRYQLQVTNQQFPGAGSDAPDVVVTDPLPSGLTATSASATQGNCTIAARVVTCDLGTLAGPATRLAGDAAVVHCLAALAAEER